MEERCNVYISGVLTPKIRNCFSVPKDSLPATVDVHLG